MSEEHYLFIQSATEKSRERDFVKKKEHLICKFNEIQQHQVKETTSKLQPHILNQALLTLPMLH